jgi:hypothetical protein
MNADGKACEAGVIAIAPGASRGFALGERPKPRSGDTVRAGDAGLLPGRGLSGFMATAQTNTKAIHRWQPNAKGEHSIYENPCQSVKSLENAFAVLHAFRAFALTLMLIS